MKERQKELEKEAERERERAREREIREFREFSTKLGIKKDSSVAMGGGGQHSQMHMYAPLSMQSGNQQHSLQQHSGVPMQQLPLQQMRLNSRQNYDASGNVPNMYSNMPAIGDNSNNYGLSHGFGMAPPLNPLGSGGGGMLGMNNNASQNHGHFFENENSQRKTPRSIAVPPLDHHHHTGGVGAGRQRNRPQPHGGAGGNNYNVPNNTGSSGSAGNAGQGISMIPLGNLQNNGDDGGIGFTHEGGYLQGAGGNLRLSGNAGGNGYFPTGGIVEPHANGQNPYGIQGASPRGSIGLNNSNMQYYNDQQLSGGMMLPQIYNSGSSNSAGNANYLNDIVGPRAESKQSNRSNNEPSYKDAKDFNNVGYYPGSNAPISNAANNVNNTSSNTHTKVK